MRHPHRHYQLIQQLYVLIDDQDRRILGEFGLNASQYRLLMLLNPTDGQRLTTLSSRLLLSKSTVTRAVDQLEQFGWVRRAADPTDRRAQRVLLTPAGDRQREAISEAHWQAHQKWFDTLTKQEQREVEALLAKLCTGLLGSSEDAVVS